MLLDLLPLFSNTAQQDTTGSRYTAPPRTARTRSHHRLRLHLTVTHDVTVTATTRTSVQSSATHRTATTARTALVSASHLSHRTRVSDDDLALLLLAASRMEAPT